MTTASSVARSAAVVREVADDATPSSLTASAAASLRAVGILIEVLDVSSSPSSRSSLSRSMAVCRSMQVMYHASVVQIEPNALRSAAMTHVGASYRYREHARSPRREWRRSAAHLDRCLLSGGERLQGVHWTGPCCTRIHRFQVPA